ncbi:MAG: thiamine pyrophosphate-dependent enzyme [Acidobacteriota bacterium]|nr:thiamine pyrophosphate-dependent enzyme [Blastocatellia bacterium]MDW8411768.1 thiamine pyrophosphate-dependent enzyme [Acidobacteriota bacterium]
MKRYPAYDPPEYVDWQPDIEVMKCYKQTLLANEARWRIIEKLSVKQLLDIYAGLLRQRLHDIALKRWVKLGVISKAWLGTGEEAVTIGCVHALDRSRCTDGTPVDFVSPMIRNAGACHEMGMSLADMLRGYLATADSPTKGRDLHIGSLRDGVIAPISHLGDITAVSNGIALSFKLRREKRLILTWIGDGTTKAGVTHEALNFAAVNRLPIIFVIQNNQVALGTKLETYHKGNFADWPSSYGIYGATFDGNNVLDAYAATALAAEIVRSGRGPALLVAETFRMGGHATHDETEARRLFPKEVFEYWAKRDPIGCYEQYLIENYDLAGETLPEKQDSNRRVLAALEEQIVTEIEQAVEEALASRRIPIRPESAVEGVYV